jgi:hypothetical protein
MSDLEGTEAIARIERTYRNTRCLDALSTRGGFRARTMESWVDFYRRLAFEAQERAAVAPPSDRAALQRTAAEWAELADWVERQHQREAA